MFAAALTIAAGLLVGNTIIRSKVTLSHKKHPEDFIMIRDFFDRRYAKKDIMAGLTLAVESVPDGMAVGALAAVNPINGVYAYMVGGFSGAFFTSSVSMSIQATSAMAVIIATVPEVALGQPTAKDALLLLAVLTGLLCWSLACCAWVGCCALSPILLCQPSPMPLASQ